ncbi:p21-C-terminal region-binding protein-domain-containing protein [Cantharellus anzutake]|uniref:p21-C-terminal region-binding protein-domain-containing protein n=1 Tax=Cantharellus anzutake TaxID=1750568 RepID=UPI001906581C|nr:p21-C-terminal region-binding protein-domain-containing protein [Cantharellus anzutake]KAF8329093.1 p21-C-terminal region-binding protein-domain-containing protein [Cantharellus anzutake]
MLTQLFQSDSELVNVHDLAHLIVSQELPGTTVKTDGIDGDPYAFLTVVNLNACWDHPAISALSNYLLAKCEDDTTLLQILRPSRDPSSTSHIGLILSERLINMPIQVVPPLYRMLRDEMKTAIREDKPCLFSYYAMVSRTYHMPHEDGHVDSGAESGPPAKRPRATSNKHNPRFHSYHHEDDVWEELGQGSHHFRYTHHNPQEVDSFGAEVGGKLTLLSAEHFSTLVDVIQQRYSST